jgi:hypothetical protein
MKEMGLRAYRLQSECSGYTHGTDEIPAVIETLL